MPLIYKITFPNGKIYVGSDLTDSAWYFGSPSIPAIANDYPVARDSEFTITKKIVWYDPDADKTLTLAKENEMIIMLQANDPRVGYNRRPKFREKAMKPNQQPEPTATAVTSVASASDVLRCDKSRPSRQP